jgi:hypothetical protein
VALLHIRHRPAPDTVAKVSKGPGYSVYVSTGTGTWCTPMRFDSEPELTLVRLMRAEKSSLVAKRLGGNVTGLDAFATDLRPKGVELIAQIPVVQTIAGTV